MPYYLIKPIDLILLLNLYYQFIICCLIYFQSDSPLNCEFYASKFEILTFEVDSSYLVNIWMLMVKDHLRFLVYF